MAQILHLDSQSLCPYDNSTIASDSCLWPYFPIDCNRNNIRFCYKNKQKCSTVGGSGLNTIKIAWEALNTLRVFHLFVLFYTTGGFHVKRHFQAKLDTNLWIFMVWSLGNQRKIDFETFFFSTNFELFPTNLHQSLVFKSRSLAPRFLWWRTLVPFFPPLFFRTKKMAKNGRGL